SLRCTARLASLFLETPPLRSLPLPPDPIFYGDVHLRQFGGHDRRLRRRGGLSGGGLRCRQMRGPVVDDRGPGSRGLHRASIKFRSCSGRAGDVVPAHLDQDAPAARLPHPDPPGGHAGAALTEPCSD
ncbi:unnamed protein product, partial [Urochloa humidicola]